MFLIIAQIATYMTNSFVEHLQKNYSVYFWVSSLSIPRIYFLYSAAFICCCVASFQDALMFRAFGKDKKIGEPADVIQNTK